MQNIYYNQCNIYFAILFEIEVTYIIKNSVKLSRNEKKLTQEELAEKVGVTRQTIGLIEKEKYNPTIALGLKLCKVLNMSLDQLFWAEEDAHEK